MAKYVFKGNVHHGVGDKKIHKFVKGQECPKDFHDVMLKQGLIEALPEAVRVEPEDKK